MILTKQSSHGRVHYRKILSFFRLSFKYKVTAYPGILLRLLTAESIDGKHNKRQLINKVSFLENEHKLSGKFWCHFSYIFHLLNYYHLQVSMPTHFIFQNVCEK